MPHAIASVEVSWLKTLKPKWWRLSDMATAAFPEASLLQRVFLTKVSYLGVTYESLMQIY